MSAFLSRVNLHWDPEGKLPPILETQITWDMPFKKDPIMISNRKAVSPELVGAAIFDMLHLMIRSMVMEIADKYGITVEEPIPSEEEMEMLRRQYEEGLKQWETSLQD